MDYFEYHCVEQGHEYFLEEYDYENIINKNMYVFYRNINFIETLIDISFYVFLGMLALKIFIVLVI